MKNKQYEYYHNVELFTLKDFLKYCTDKYTNNIAFSFKVKKDICNKTYNEFNNDVQLLGKYLLDLVGKNNNIAILGENSYEWVLSYFSIVNTSNVVVPVDKELNVEDVENILKTTESKVLIYANSYNDYAKQIEDDKLDIKLINMQEILSNIIPNLIKQNVSVDDYIKIEPKPDDDAAIIFTSGTTGISKGVVITNKNICINVTSGMKSLKMYGTTILALPLHHTYALSGNVLCPMFWGCKNYINYSLKNFADDISTQRPNFILSVPMMVETFYKKIWKVAKTNKKDKILRIMIKISNCLLKLGIDVRRKLFKSVLDNLGGNLDMIVCGGALLDVKYQKFFDDIGIHVVVGYGITECSPFIAVNRNNYSRLGSAGLPLTCSEVKIDKKDGDKEGEIIVKGDMVMKGYYKNPELTKEVMVDGYFKTGDIGYQDKDGFIYINGRKKNVIILSNGKNVYPEELEALLIKNEAINEVIVKEKDNKIIAEIYPNKEEIENRKIDNVLEYFRNYIDEINKTQPLFKNINDVELRDTEFEKTTSKKIKRNYINKK